MHRAALLLLVCACCVVVVVSGGCAQPVKAPATGYYGPTEPLATVVNRINENNRKIPTLYARHEIEANIVQDGRSRFINADGYVFARKPREFYLKGNKVLDKIFEMGSTDEVYWFTVYGGENTRWWGHYRNVGKPCSQTLEVRPDLVGEVLGVGDVNSNLLELPVPTMRFNNDLDVYMVEWHTRGPDRFVTEKEVWYDRATLMPRKVLLFDAHGRPVLRANLGRHEPVEVKGLPEEQWPRMATQYDLRFIESGSTMTLRLSEMALVSPAGHPRQGTVRFREDGEVEKDVQLDEACEK